MNIVYLYNIYQMKINYETQGRKWKRSACWYRDVIKTNGYKDLILKINYCSSTRLINSNEILQI